MADRELDEILAANRTPGFFTPSALPTTPFSEPPRTYDYNTILAPTRPTIMGQAFEGAVYGSAVGLVPGIGMPGTLIAAGIGATYMGGREVVDRLVDPFTGVGARTLAATSRMFGTQSHLSMIEMQQQLQASTMAHMTAGPHLSPMGSGMTMAATGEYGRGLRDMGLDRGISPQDMSSITDLAHSSGLMRMAQNPDQMVETIGNVIKTIGMVARMTGDPDVRNALESISQLQDMGLTLPQTSGAMQNARVFARMMGTSVQGMMEGPGMAGVQMAAQLGLTPGVGQLPGQMAGALATAGVHALDQGLHSRIGGEAGLAQANLGMSGAYMQTIAPLMALSGQQNVGNLAQLVGGAVAGFNNQGLTPAQVIMQQSGMVSGHMAGLSGVDLQMNQLQVAREVQRTIPGLDLAGALHVASGNQLSYDQSTALAGQFESPDFWRSQIRHLEIEQRERQLAAEQQLRARGRLPWYTQLRRGLVEPIQEDLRGWSERRAYRAAYAEDIRQREQFGEIVLGGPSFTTPEMLDFFGERGVEGAFERDDPIFSDFGYGRHRRALERELRGEIFPYFRERVDTARRQAGWWMVGEESRQGFTDYRENMLGAERVDTRDTRESLDRRVRYARAAQDGLEGGDLDRAIALGKYRGLGADEQLLVARAAVLAGYAAQGDRSALDQEVFYGNMEDTFLSGFEGAERERMRGVLESLGGIEGATTSAVGLLGSPRAPVADLFERANLDIRNIPGVTLLGAYSAGEFDMEGPTQGDILIDRMMSRDFSIDLIKSTDEALRLSADIHDEARYTAGAQGERARLASRREFLESMGIRAGVFSRFGDSVREQFGLTQKHKGVVRNMGTVTETFGEVLRAARELEVTPEQVVDALIAVGEGDPETVRLARRIQETGFGDEFFERLQEWSGDYEGEGGFGQHLVGGLGRAAFEDARSYIDTLSITDKKGFKKEFPEAYASREKDPFGFIKAIGHTDKVEGMPAALRSALSIQPQDAGLDEQIKTLQGELENLLTGGEGAAGAEAIGREMTRSVSPMVGQLGELVRLMQGIDNSLGDIKRGLN